MRKRIVFRAAPVIAALFFAVAGRAVATEYLSDDYSTYADGNLVGQNGWVQFSSSTNGSPSSSTLPVQVSGGSYVIPPMQSGDNQDVAKSLTTTVAAGAGVDVYAGLHFTMQNAALLDGNPFTSPSYFMGFWDTTATTVNTTATPHFVNYRILAAQNPLDTTHSTYFLETRVTGQAGSPFQSGTIPLVYGQTYNVVIQAHLTGDGSEFSQIYVNPTHSDLSLETPYVTANINTGSPSPSIGAFVVSQFASATSGNSGFTVGSTHIANNGEEASHWLNGDVNFDGVVNGLDIAAVASNWLASGTYLKGDANGDGVVNGLDIAAVASNWLASYSAPPGAGGGAGSATAVPEPSTMALAGCGLIALLIRRRFTSARCAK